MQVDEFREIDDERVLVLSRLSGRGRSTGLDLGHVPHGGASLFHIRDGQVARLILYGSVERAYADLGLTPDTGS